MATKTKKAQRKIRHKRVRAKIAGTAKKPRLSVFRSANHIYAQLIDDEKGRTLISVSDIAQKKGKKSERARAIGKLIAKEAAAKKIQAVVFDRGGYLYHGRIKALAEGAREEGLKF